MAGKKICIVTQSHLCRNPRVLKEALALAGAGYLVTIINSTYDRSLAIEDRSLINDQNINLIPVARLESGGLLSFGDRLLKKTGDALVRYFKIQTPLALGYAALRYKTIALKQNADLYICHQELGLYCGVQLLRSKKKTAFDFEDWYSEDLLNEARQKRPIRLLKKLEQCALQNGAFCFTTSHAMANELSKIYKARTPSTVYNSFATDEEVLLRPKLFEPPLKLLWFSQTIGPGRGLEAFLRLIAKTGLRLEVHLLGAVTIAYKEELTAIQDTHPVFFHAPVPAGELAGKIADFDIGLALEETHPRSRDLTITNKFFQYIQSGLPVIATATSGQVEIFSKHKPGFLVDDYDSPGLLKRLESWLQNTAELKSARDSGIALAHEYCGNKEYLKVLKLTADVL